MADPTRLVLLVPNIVTDARRNTTAGGGHGELGFYAGAGHENALSEEPGETTRWLHRRGNVMRVDFNAGIIGMDWAGVAGLTCGKDALVRFSSFDPVAEYIVPTGTTVVSGSWSAVGGGAATHANLDDGIGTQDSLYVRPGSSGSQLRLTFPTPAADPEVGEGMNHFVVVVKIPDAAGSGLDAVVTVSLQESGSTVANLGERRVGIAGQDVSLIFPWDADDLATASGANVEILIQCNWFDGGDVDRPDLGSVTWCRSAVAVGGGATSAMDSRYMSVKEQFYLQSTGSLWGPQYLFDTVDMRYEEDHFGGAVVRPRTVWYQRPKVTAWDDVVNPAAEFQELWIHVLDDGIPRGGSSGSADGYAQSEEQVEPLEFAALGLGFSQELSCSYAEGDPIELVDPSERKRTAGGQLYGVRRPAYRRLKLKHEDTLDSEAWEIFERLMVQRGTLRPFFAVLHPGDDPGSLSRKHTSGYWRLAELRGPSAENRWDSELLSPIELVLEEAL